MPLLLQQCAVLGSAGPRMGAHASGDATVHSVQSPCMSALGDQHVLQTMEAQQQHMMPENAHHTLLPARSSDRSDCPPNDGSSVHAAARLLRAQLTPFTGHMPQ